MRRFGWKAFAVAVFAALLVPAASASRAPHVKLALIPLPKAAIGPAAHGLAIAHDSGTISNLVASSHTSDGTPATFKKLGRMTGYVLEYGEAFTGATGVTNVHTGIDQYRTAADAKRGLAFWRKEDAGLGALDNPAFTVSNVPVKMPAVGSKRFAYLTTYSAANIASVSGLDEQFVEGRYVLDVIVYAGTKSAAKTLVAKLAKKLDARLQLALEGRLRAKPVALPAQQTAGPPTGGPDLSTLALQATDLVGEAAIDQSYFVDPAAVSDYSVFMLPAGPFDLLDQEIEWYSSANEANFFADFENAAEVSQSGSTVLDLSALGDGAQASVDEGLPGSFSSGAVVFAKGQLAEFIFIASFEGPLVTSDITNVAQAAVTRLDAGYAG